MKWKKKKMNNKISYLEYYKTVIQKVSFCKDLMKKEYLKATKTIEPHEVNHFNDWMKMQKHLEM